MSRFNTPTTGTMTVNLAGGEAYTQNPELELTSILLTSFAYNQFHRSANDTFAKLKSLVYQCDPEFVAKAAIYARVQYGMRSITHVVASELAKYISGKPWGKDFYRAIVYRPDDMMEILSYHKSQGQKIPAAMKRGFALAFNKFDAYRIAKYRGEGKDISLVDVVNLVHPRPIEKNAEALNQLVNGTLKSTDTWESQMTTAGQTAKNETDKAEMKSAVWGNLLRENKLGYFALLRNLRNIVEQAPDVLPLALERLVDEEIISKSLVLPFRYISAYDEIVKLSNGVAVRQIMQALNKAVDLSVKNVPVFPGDTLVVLDTSDSMDGLPAKIGSLLTAVLVKSNNADLITFDSQAHYRQVNPDDSTLTISQALRFSGGGTNFHSIFQRAARKYDRIIILSDMQGWVGYKSPVGEFNDYKQKTGADPYVYSFDLQGYGSMQFPQRKVYCLAGFSEKVFDIMKLLEEDKEALVNKIKEVEL